MSFIRLLTLSYLAWAAVFVVAVVLVAHVPLPQNHAPAVAQKATKNAVKPPANKQQAPVVARLDLVPETPASAPRDTSTVTHTDVTPAVPAQPPSRARPDLAPPHDAGVVAHADVAAPPAPRTVQEPKARLAMSGQPSPGAMTTTPDLPEPPVPAPPPEHGPQPSAGFHIPDPPPLDAPIFGRGQFAAARLAAGLTPEMVRNFDLFLYVSKADAGPFSQHMYVLQKQPAGGLKLLYDWPVSTGRERREVNAHRQRAVTTTPSGYYELDPDRMYRSYHSDDWDEDMPNAMFFNWERNGAQTGLAIHAAASRDIDRLGTRASAGCVHLAPKNAATLFDLIRTQYRGRVPRFAYDDDSETMNNQGRLMHDRAGKLVMADGYRVLVRIENYGGDNGVPATLF